MPAIRDAFATAYAARYTSVYAGVGIMAVSFRVRCRGPLPSLSLTEAGARPAGSPQKATRAAWFDGGFVDTPVYDRYALAQGARIAGPAIIEEREATTIIPPGDSVTVDATGTLAIDIGLAADAGRARHRGNAARAGGRADREPIRFHLKSCGAGSSRWWRRCGTPSAAPPSH